MKGLNKEILKLAIPSIFANITIPLVGMVDIAITGHLGSLSAAEGFSAAALIGGISIGSMLFDLLYWNFAFLRVGTGGITAQAYGRYRKAVADSDESGAGAALHGCADALGRATGIALVSGAALIALQWFVVQFAFLFVQSSPEVRVLAERYFSIRIWAAPASLCLFSLKGWFIGMQDTVSSMITDLIVNFTNIAVSCVLAFGAGSFAGIGYNGVAVGTVTAQYSGLAFASAVVAVKYRKLVFRGYRFRDILSSLGIGASGRARRTELRGFFSMNADLLVRSLCFIAIYNGFTIISARYGDTMLAAGSVMMKIMLVFSYFTDGFAYAGEAVTGKYIGMKDRERTVSAVRLSFIWSMSIACIFGAVYIIEGTRLLRLMTPDAEVLGAARSFMPWVILMPFLGCPAFTWDGIYIGATATAAARNSAFFSMLAFFVTWFASITVFKSLSGIPDTRTAGCETIAMHLLFAAYFAHIIVRTVYQTVLYKRAIIKPHFG